MSDTPRARAVKGRKGFQPVAIEERHRIAARKLANGAAIMPTMIEAGYSPHTAAHGVNGIKRCGPLARAVQEQLMSQSDTVALPPDRQAVYIQNKLMENVALGRDRAVGSLTTLARIRNMLQPEATTLVQINVAAPSAAAGQWDDGDNEKGTP